MKKLLLIFLAGIVFSCNDKGTDSKETTKDTATAVKYPYTIAHPDNWVEGSTANTLVALSGLKAWEEGKIDESMTYFGDSVTLRFDGIDKKMLKDSLKLILGGGRSMYKTVNIKMSDWESVVSKDKSEEWVTLWYTQSWETPQGVKDSASVINDLQIKDGKIIRLDEHTRKLH
jgi:hypothetical protein